MSERAPKWIPVMFVPFGPRIDQAGALITKEQASQPVVPPSFAIDRDGSVWMIDLVKHRILHFDASGGLIEVVGGLEFDRHRPYAQDLGFADGQLYVTEFTHNSLQTYFRTVSREGIGRRVRVESRGHPLLITHLISPQPQLTGFSVGRSGVGGNPVRGGGPIGYQLIDSMSGVSVAVAGALMEDGSRLGSGPQGSHDDQRTLVHHAVRGTDTQRFLRLRVQPAAGNHVRIPAVAGWQTYAALPHGFATYVMFSPARLRDQKRYQGSTRWLLEYFDDGQPLVWEPLPVAPLRHAYVWRYLCQGLDGHLYLMLAERGGMRIYRHPGPPADGSGSGLRPSTNRIPGRCGLCTWPDACTPCRTPRWGSGCS
jgi:hypothetical protein